MALKTASKEAQQNFRDFEAHDIESKGVFQWHSPTTKKD